MTILQEGESFFGRNPDTPTDAILPLQVDPTSPSVVGLEPASGMILPDRLIGSRLDHFPPDLYDLRESSHLMRFLKALMGDSGAGQLRKRLMLAQLQASMASARFYDLDRFYGAIFGATRFVNEALWFNPYVEEATPLEWDEVERRDTAYRSRIFQLAKSINMGGTVPGLKAAAESLVQTECDVYETWALLESLGATTPGRTWGEMQVEFDNWDDIEAEYSWGRVEGRVVIGRAGTNAITEVTIRPRKDYSSIEIEDGWAEANRQRAEDTNAILRVLRVLKPAATLLTVNPEGVPLHEPAWIADIKADSTLWEVQSKVSPKPILTKTAKHPYPLSQRQREQGMTELTPRVLPEPPLRVSQGVEVTFAPDVLAIESVTLDENDAEIEGAVGYDMQVYQDGSSDEFSPDLAMMDPSEALSAQYSGDGAVVAAPYSDDRRAVAPHE